MLSISESESSSESPSTSESGSLDDGYNPHQVIQNEIGHIVTDDSRMARAFLRIDFLGEGGFGTVMSAENRLDGSVSAVKAVPFSAPEKGTVMREVTVLAGLPTHPNIVAYRSSWVEHLDQITDPDLLARLREVTEMSAHHVPPSLVLFLQMEHCTMDLKSILAEQNECFFNAVRVADQWSAEQQQQNHWRSRDLVSGLEFLHSRDPKIIHRDIKPANILFDGATRYFKLSDFGLSRLLDTDRTLTGCGTKAYAAPEQMTRSPHYDERVDVYSLGLVLLEIYVPFEGERERGHAFFLLKESRVVPEALEQPFPRLAGLIRAMVSRDPADRPDLSLLQELLREFL